MSLKLWELAALALPMFAILALQAIGVALFTTFVTFRVMGSNYEADGVRAPQYAGSSAPSCINILSAPWCSSRKKMSNMLPRGIRSSAPTTCRI